VLGEIVDGEMQLNEAGKIVEEEWLRTPVIRTNIELDTFVIMPNHIHGIIILNDLGRGTSRRAPTRERFGKPTSNSIPTIIRLFKSATTKRINEINLTPGAPVWQRNYYERIIRDERELNNIREYITNNVLKWAFDSSHEMPDNLYI
jgi:REP element-mobilizing transposase RayT